MEVGHQSSFITSNDLFFIFNDSEHPLRPESNGKKDHLAVSEDLTDCMLARGAVPGDATVCWLGGPNFYSMLSGEERTVITMP